ncbi:hypothetical protein CPC08DRAFT_765375 [Agrocybe pediades]|nr:hypothetical protein CPC08DRAFT_765375 [Agrocybe pediades]
MCSERWQRQPEITHRCSVACCTPPCTDPLQRRRPQQLFLEHHLCEDYVRTGEEISQALGAGVGVDPLDSEEIELTEEFADFEPCSFKPSKPNLNLKLELEQDVHLGIVIIMPSFAEIKAKASNVTSSGVSKIQNVRDRNTSVPLKKTNWDPYSGEPPPPPPPPRTLVRASTKPALAPLPPPPSRTGSGASASASSSSTSLAPGAGGGRASGNASPGPPPIVAATKPNLRGRSPVPVPVPGPPPPPPPPSRSAHGSTTSPPLGGGGGAKPKPPLPVRKASGQPLQPSLPPRATPSPSPGFPRVSLSGSGPPPPPVRKTTKPSLVQAQAQAEHEEEEEEEEERGMYVQEKEKEIDWTNLSREDKESLLNGGGDGGGGGGGGCVWGATPSWTCDTIRCGLDFWGFPLDWSFGFLRLGRRICDLRAIPSTLNPPTRSNPLRIIDHFRPHRATPNDIHNVQPSDSSIRDAVPFHP